MDKEDEFDTFENFKNSNKMQCKEVNNIEKFILMHKQRMYRVNEIISLKSKIKLLMKEFCDISKSQKELLDYFCIVQESMINIHYCIKIHN